MGRRAVASAAALAGLLLAAVCPSAQAASLNSVQVSGAEAAVSCLSARLCVLAGSRNGAAALVTVRDGDPVRYYRIPKTVLAYDVSCPNASGCVATERPSGLGPVGLSETGVSTKLTIISASGAPIRTVPITMPAGVTLARISCTSPHNCELAGESVFSRPAQLAFGTWNGHRMTVRYMRAPGNVNLQPGDISCSGVACVLVGSVYKNGQTDGFVVTTRDGRPTGDRLIPGDDLYGVSCTSTTLCYAPGENDSSDGIVVPLRRGNAGVPIDLSGPVSGIACRGQLCTAAGAFPVYEDESYGTILFLSDGQVTSSAIVPDSAGFDSVALAGSSFAAIGPANGPGSELTTG